MEPSAWLHSADNSLPDREENRFSKAIDIGIRNKTTPDLSIVKRLGGSSVAKILPHRAFCK